MIMPIIDIADMTSSKNIQPERILTTGTSNKDKVAFPPSPEFRR